MGTCTTSSCMSSVTLRVYVLMCAYHILHHILSAQINHRDKSHLPAHQHYKPLTLCTFVRTISIMHREVVRHLVVNVEPCTFIAPFAFEQPFANLCKLVSLSPIQTDEWHGACVTLIRSFTGVYVSITRRIPVSCQFYYTTIISIYEMDVVSQHGPFHIACTSLTGVCPTTTQFV